MSKYIIPLLLLLIISAGCLDAKLTEGEVALCTRISNAELTHIQSCTTANACQTLFRKTQVVGIGIATGSGTLVERAERETISGWMSLTQATQKLQRLRNACGQGTIGGIWQEAQAAGIMLGEALQHSESSQVYSWEALQQTLRETEKLQLEEVRDSEAFAAYASAAEFIQEIITNNTKSSLAQKMQSNNLYFASLSQQITGKESQAYSINTESGFDLLKTPIKIIQPGNAGKLIVALFPAWNSFINSMRTRKNAVKGIQVIQQLKASEIIYHAETVMAPQTGIHATIMDQIKKIESGINELHEEEQQHRQKAAAILPEQLQALGEIEDKINDQRDNYLQLQKWNPRFIASTTSTERITKARNEHQNLQHHYQQLTLAQEQNSIPLGKRINQWRKWLRAIEQNNALLEETKTISNQFNDQCQELGHKILAQAENPALKLAAKETAEAKEEKVAEYCAKLLQKLEEASFNTTISLEEIGKQTNFSSCVEKVNQYLEVLELGEKISKEEWLANNFGDPLLATTACQSMLQNVETAYESSTEVRGWNEAQKEAEELLIIIQRLKHTIENTGQLSATEAEIRKMLNGKNNIETYTKTREKKFELEEKMRRGRDIIQEMIQEIADQKRWETIAPAQVEMNTQTSTSIQWKMENPVNYPIPFPLTLVIDLPPGAQITESSTLQEVQDQLATLRIAHWDNPIQLTANWNGIPVAVQEETTIGELVGNQTSIRVVLQTTARVNAKLKVDFSKYGLEENIYVSAANASIHEGQSQKQKIIHLKQEKNKIVGEGQTSNAIQTTTTLQNTAETNSAQVLTYTVTWENKLEKAFKLSASTGIRTDPIETLSISATNELGEVIPWSTSANNGLAILNQEISAKGTRKFTIIITQPLDSATWQVLQANLLQELIAYTQSPFPGIASKAIALRHRIEQWNGDTQKWAENLQKWQIELESLAAEENNLWQKKNSLQKRTQLLSMDAQNEEWNNQRKTLGEALANNNLGMAESALSWLETNAISITPNEPVQSLKERQQAELSHITTINRTITSTREKIAAYTQAQGFTCTRLLEVNFICPLSESQIKDIKGELDILQKELRTEEKLLEKKESTEEELAASSATISQLESSVNVIAQRIGDAQASLREHARQVENALQSYNNQEQQWKESVAKVVESNQKDEYGKAIYVGRNLLNYAESQKGITSGLAILPEKTLPLVGVILVIGGAGLFQWWKKKNVKPAEMKSIPRTEKIIVPLELETKNGEATLPNKKMEFPQPPLNQTKP